ncbi:MULTISPECIES: N-acetyl sugar amidotransferase [unclassified Clostridium]|uniref:N-acetyl sugar amidotransferase n=1 Tax=unclassified Clostridium TaxID=2614128 RepID=UPI000297788D|nr:MULTISPECIES: N-acetyl sugar amidotransferase [unclassified Clostridium]EKQ51125.1 MAG: N-acetyl sugar amidotransferase [Clostridium sp. Maddingley MBC34-26]
MYKRNVEINYSKYEGDQNLEAKYGLPNEVEFCTECVISNQRPNSCVEFKHNKESKKETIKIDENGLCDACKANKEKQKVDWELREKELIELCNKYRKNDGSYDCLIPGSGGKDSFYQAHILKYKYGMHPLTITWAPHMYTEWGWNNFQSWIHAGFDNILHTPDGKIHRLLTRLAVENLFHPFQPFIIGQKALAPKIAALYDIPLIFYGENEAEYGNPIADNSSAKRDWSYFTASDKSKIQLSGVSIESLEKDFGLNDVDLKMYMPANPELLEKKNIEVHYLGYYLRWHPQEAYYYAVEHGNFKPSPERTAGTYSKYNSIDDKIDDFHYYTTYIKFGIGRATYDAAQEIRNGEITREEGIALVKKYDGEYPERFEKDVFEYLSINEDQFPIASKMFEQPKMDRDYFMHLAERFRSQHLWKWENGIWKLRHTIFEE